MKSRIRKSKEKALISSVKCDECEHEFLLNAVNIQEANVDIKGQSLTLIFFTCPKCNKIYRVSLTDSRCYELREDIEKTKNRIRRNHGSNNQELAKVLGAMVSKKQERLRNYTDKLNKKFPGTFAFEMPGDNSSKVQAIKYLP